MEAEIEGILYLILNHENLTNSELIRLTGLPKETLKTFKLNISSLLISDRDKDNNVSIIFRKEVIPELRALNLKPYKWSLVSYSDPDIEKRLNNLREKYNLKPSREYDQFFADAGTTVSKMMLLTDKGLIRGKRIALLGDDDLLSIALGLEGGYAQITVFDIDRELLTAIEDIVKYLGLKNIRTVYFDAREDLNPNIPHEFDVVVTDPPYTRNGVFVFLNSAIRLSNKDSFIFLYYGNSFKTPEKTLKIQDIINSYNLLIEDKINKFASYYGAESIGSSSSVYVLRKTPFTQPRKENLLIDNIYTFETHKEERFPFVDHYTFKLFNVPQNLLESRKHLLSAVDKFCQIHKLKVVDTKVTQFKGKGLTLTYVLANSNMSVRTWPEHQALHIDLITCSPIYNKGSLANTAGEIFQTNSIEIRKVE